MIWSMVALMIVLQLAFTYVPALQSLFGTSSLGLGGWGWCLATAVITCAVVEVDKWRRDYVAGRRREQRE
ncbi:hypothetical protein D9M69_708960 [compost metagenome]